MVNEKFKKTVVMSLGGSVVCPEEVDVDYLMGFRDLIYERMKADECQFVIIIGGGKVCRKWQDSAKKLGCESHRDLDWIGIMASRMNAEVVRSAFADNAYEFLVNNPEQEFDESKPIIVGAGYQPGSSTDLRAVQLAKRLGAERVINVSNITQVYTDDPKVNPEATPIDSISWSEFTRMVGSEWKPGLNVPFDPIASKFAMENGLEVDIIGKDLDTLKYLLTNKEFIGTKIHAD